MSCVIIYPLSPKRVTEQERQELSRCALCGQEATGGRNGHLLFKCTHHKVVEVRKQVQLAVGKCVERRIKPGAVREAVLVPWALLGEGRLPDLGRVEEVLHQMTDAKEPAEAGGREWERQAER